jgi:hypothetical protein
MPQLFNTAPALTQQWVLEATWTDIPDDVNYEIRDIWENQEFGNDDYYYQWSDADKEGPWYGEGKLLKEMYPKLASYLAERDVSSCLIHYWW